MRSFALPLKAEKEAEEKQAGRSSEEQRSSVASFSFSTASEKVAYCKGRGCRDKELSSWINAALPKLHSSMASRNGSDPTDRRRTERRRSSLERASEDQVAQETEEVFHSYVYYRYQQEHTEGDVPVDPEIAEIPQEPNSIPSQVGRRLVIIADDINSRYDKEFSDMLKSLQPTMDNAYDYFINIASSLFDSGINWGRVIALLGFGYRMAIHVYQHGLTGFLRRIARYIADFVLRNHIAQWIAQQGGWVAALDLSNVYWKYVVAVAAVILLGHFVVRRFFSQ